MTSGARPILNTWLTLYILMIAMVFGLGTTASAHSASSHVWEWVFNATERVAIDNNVPPSMRPDIVASMGPFSDMASGQSVNFDYSSVVFGEQDFDGCTGGGNSSIVFAATHNRMEEQFNSSGIFAVTDTCPPRGEPIYRFEMTFNLNPTGNGFPGSTGWNLGSGVPSATEWDFRSTLIHEFGHAAGFTRNDACDGHICETLEACGDNLVSRSTMCPGRPANRGTSYRRTPEVHDVHTFDGAYSS